MKNRAKLGLYCLLAATFAGPANGQFKLQETFEGTTAPGWTLINSAVLTAPSIDAAGSGWLRLTGAVNNAKGLAINSAFSFPGSQPVVVRFNYVSWGGTGADGMTLFLYDSSTASPMASAFTGGGLGYCGGAGGYLAVGLDEFGNFSNPGDKCLGASGGPGIRPESLVIRGPVGLTNPWIATTSISGGIDNPHAASRPSPKSVLFVLTPATAPAVGYTITAQFQSGAGQPYQTLFSNVSFPYAPPANLSVGFSGSTGGSTNIHELHGLTAATPDDLQVTVTGPSSALQGASVTYTVTVTNNGNYLLTGGDAPTITDALPASIGSAQWTCIGSGGGSCDASGTGNINTSNVTLPANASVAYTVTGMLNASTACGSTLSNSANADFGTGSTFLDSDETNNTATINSTVACDTTLVANPTSLTFSPQQVGVPSGTQTVTVTEGINPGTILSIAATGDFSQTNNCPSSSSTIAAAQTCVITVEFTPSTPGSRNGTLTIQSSPTGSPSTLITTVVTLSGTGINSIPDPFNFTPLTNVTPASMQVSNPITVSSTTVPVPISVSAGGQYSINGGSFTSIPSVVSPGAQVRVALTAASGYGATNSASIVIGGVSSTFSVTTGAQPPLQGAFTPVVGAVAGSLQTSNAITVSGTLSEPLSVSAGTAYSINGGPFTSSAGTVQPGDQVSLQMTAASTYNTTSSAVLTVGGVTSTFSVTTAAQAPPQAAFTAVTGATLASTQTSNAVTLTDITAPSTIKVSDGALYSINGGPFTSAPGTVLPGDQVRVKVNAADAYDTTTTADLSVGQSTLSFAVTTGAKPVLQGSFSPVSAAANSSVYTSNPITVIGISSPAVISVSSGASYSINGGPFTSEPGTVQSGDHVAVRLEAPSSYDSGATATLTINGVSASFVIRTGSPPLKNVTVSGGGAVDVVTLLLFGFLIASRWFRTGGKAALAGALLMSGVGVLWIAPVRADVSDWSSNLYGGVRIGASTSSMTAARLAASLRDDGFQVSAAGAERGTAAGTIYSGYELGHQLAAEAAFTYVGRTRATLQGVQQSNLPALLADTAHIVRGSGDILALELRYRWPVAQSLGFDLRAGPYLWLTSSDVYVSSADQLRRTDRGLGYTLGLGPRWVLGRHVSVGAAADYFNSTSDSRYWLFAATLEYRFN